MLGWKKLTEHERMTVHDYFDDIGEEVFREQDAVAEVYVKDSDGVRDTITVALKKVPGKPEINSGKDDNKPAEETLVNQGEFPKDSKGKDDYLADGVTAESALARMREKGLANDEIEQMMQNRLKKSKKPTMGDDEDKFLEAKNRYNREQEIYNGVLDLLKGENKRILIAITERSFLHHYI